MFFLNKMWTKPVKDDFVSIAMWTPDVINTTKLINSVRSKTSQPGYFCTQPGIYDYQWDKAGVWKYSGYTCVELCPLGAAEPDCVIGTEAVYANTKEVFFATEVTRTYMDAGTAQMKRYFVPMEDFFELTFQYDFEVPAFRLKSINNLYQVENVIGSSSTNTDTVILDHKGNIKQRHSASIDGIRLKLKDVLEWAGKPNWLDLEQEVLGRNQLKGAAHPRGPVGRLTGLEVEIFLSCYYSGHVPAKLMEGGDDPDRSVCSAQVMPKPYQWVWRRSMDILDGKTTWSYFHGVRVAFQAELHMRVFDIPVLLAFLAEAIIFMQLPVKMIRFVLLNLLGLLSNIYDGVLNERFQLAQHVTASAMHFMNHSLCFNQLCDSPGRISRKQMRKSFESDFEGFEELSPREISAYSKFVFNVAINIHENKYVSYNVVAQILSFLRRLVRRKSRHMQSQGPGMKLSRSNSMSVSELDKKSFLMSACFTEQLQLHHTVMLFDQDRKVGRLERLFSPTFVRQLHKDGSIIGQRQPDIDGLCVSEDLAQEATTSDANPDLHKNVTVATLNEELRTLRCELAENRRRQQELEKTVNMFMARSVQPSAVQLLEQQANDTGEAGVEAGNNKVQIKTPGCGNDSSTTGHTMGLAQIGETALKYQDEQEQDKHKPLKLEGLVAALDPDKPQELSVFPNSQGADCPKDTKVVQASAAMLETRQGGGCAESTTVGACTEFEQQTREKLLQLEQLVDKCCRMCEVQSQQFRTALHLLTE